MSCGSPQRRPQPRSSSSSSHAAGSPRQQHPHARPAAAAAAAASARAAELAKQLGRAKAENLELAAKLDSALASLGASKRTARASLVDMVRLRRLLQLPSPATLQHQLVTMLWLLLAITVAL